MYIAMNRFRVRKGFEADFESVWRDRDSHLRSVPGFKQFSLLKGASGEDHTLYASHSIWASYDAFIAWTKSEAFRQAHRNAGANRELYLEPPVLEGFEAVQSFQGDAGDVGENAAA